MKNVDVCILGAGMAGLTLAHQVRDRCPELSIAVVEHRVFPVPEAAHKVGESTVEIAAHYLAEDLGFRPHLETAHLPKFGLRLFFRGEQRTTDLSDFDEIGASRVLPVPTYQVDRGILENHLAMTARERDIGLQDGATVRALHIERDRHRVDIGGANGAESIEARFLVDASGRRGLVRSQRGLARDPAHRNCATWFRVRGDIDVDDWGTDAAWRARCPGGSRRFSTNHLMGPGYWLWIIPLASHATSIGLVYDPALVDPVDVSSFERFRDWLMREQPLAGTRLADAELLDFHRMKNYAAGVTETFSADGWMLSGDAGLFADPFYSPGGDFIAISNTFITELIATGQPDARRSDCYQRHLQTFFSNTMSLYRGQYPGFGHRDLMILKTTWDYSYYWAVLAKLYFCGRMTDTGFMASVQPDLLRAAVLNSRIQRQIREVGSRALRQGGAGGFVDHHAVGWFHELKQNLLCTGAEDDGALLGRNIDRLESLSHSLSALLPRVAAGQAIPGLDQIDALT